MRERAEMQTDTAVSPACVSKHHLLPGSRGGGEGGGGGKLGYEIEKGSGKKENIEEIFSRYDGE